MDFPIAFLIFSFLSSALARDLMMRSDYESNSGPLGSIKNDEFMQMSNTAEGSFAPVLVLKRKLFRRQQEPVSYAYRTTMNQDVFARQRLIPELMQPMFIPTYKQSPILMRQVPFETPNEYLRSSFPAPMQMYGGRRTIYPRCFQSVYQFLGLSPKPMSKPVITTEPSFATTDMGLSEPAAAPLEPELAVQQAEAEASIQQAEAEATAQKAEAEAIAQKPEAEAAAPKVEVEATAQKTEAEATAPKTEAETSV